MKHSCGLGFDIDTGAVEFLELAPTGHQPHSQTQCGIQGLQKLENYHCNLLASANSNQMHHQAVLAVVGSALIISTCEQCKKIISVEVCAVRV